MALKCFATKKMNWAWDALLNQQIVITFLILQILISINPLNIQKILLNQKLNKIRFYPMVVCQSSYSEYPIPSNWKSIDIHKPSHFYDEQSFYHNSSYIINKISIQLFEHWHLPIFNSSLNSHLTTKKIHFKKPHENQSVKCTSSRKVHLTDQLYT